MSSTKPTSGVPEFLRIDNMSANEYVSTDFFFDTFEFLCQFSACQAEIRYWHNSGGYVSYYFGLFFIGKGPEIYGFCNGTKTYLEFVNANVFDLFDLQFFSPFFQRSTEQMNL